VEKINVAANAAVVMIKMNVLANQTANADAINKHFNIKKSSLRRAFFGV